MPSVNSWASSFNFDRRAFRFSRKTVALMLVSDCISSRICRAQYANKMLEVIAPKEFYLRIRISSRGKCALDGFSVVWPKGAGSFMTAKLASYLASVVSSSKHVLNDAEAVLHRLYLKGTFLYVYERLLESSIGNSFVLFKVNNEARMVFACSTSPSHEFALKIIESGVALMSCAPLVKPRHVTAYYPGKSTCTEKTFISYLLSPNASEIATVVSSIRRSVYYTRLYRLWEFVVAGMMTISMKSFHATFEESRIDIFLFQTIVCSIGLDPSTGDTVVNTFGGMGTSPDVFIEALQGCECQRNDVIKAIFTHALAKLIFGCVLGDHVGFQFRYYSESLRHYQQALNFSFAPDFVILFGEREGRPYISTRSLRRPLIVFTREIVLLQNSSESDILPILEAAAQSAKISTLVLQCEETLRNHGIIGTIENSKIHFLVEPFDCVEFDIESNGSWSLTFIKPAASGSDTMVYRFIGSEISVRFTDWILNMVSGVAAYTQIVRQMIGTTTMHTAVSSVEFHDETEFRITMIPDFCTSIYVTYTSVEFMCRSRTGRLTYNVRPAFSPKITFGFGRNVELKAYLEKLATGKLVEQVCASVITGLCVRFMRIFHIFMRGGRKWSLSFSPDLRAIFLLFRGAYTVSLLPKSTNIVAIVPDFGKSQLLQIPLEMRKVLQQAKPVGPPRHQCTLDQLERFRDTIENFFQMQQELSRIGCTGFRLNGRDLVCPFPKAVAWAKVRCFLRARSVDFEVEGESDPAKLLRAIFNFNHADVHTRILFARFVINLLDFDMRFVTHVLQITLAALDKTAVLAINWRQTMELTAVTLAESKVIFSFATDTGNTFCLEITRRENETVPDVIGFDLHGAAARMKTIKDVARWFSELEHIE